jgi:hypothetical protein
MKKIISIMLIFSLLTLTLGCGDPKVLRLFIV